MEIVLFKVTVLYNAYHAKCPPPTPPPDVARSVGATVKKVCQPGEALNSCNGDVRLLQMQGLRHMSAMQDHQSKDLMKSTGLSCRVDAAANHSQIAHDGAAVPENGTLSSSDLKRSVHFQREAAEPLAKHQRVEQSPTGNIIKLRRSMSNVSDQSAEASNSPVRAPLGIPFCSASVGGARKVPPPPVSAGEDHCTSCCEHRELLNTELLHRRMEKTAESLGLAGVTLDCADLLNNGLDKYLKSLIRSSIELIGANVQSDAIKGELYKQHAYGKHMNGVWLPNHVQIQSGSGPSGATNDIRNHHLISLDDFKLYVRSLRPLLLSLDVFMSAWELVDVSIFTPDMKRSSKDFADVHGLVMHAYNPPNADSFINHLGLHKALCVLMGWDYTKVPESSKAYQSLLPDLVQASREDLIIWPPTVIIHNTATGRKKDGRAEGLGNKEMDKKISGVTVLSTQECHSLIAGESAGPLLYLAQTDGSESAEYFSLLSVAWANMPCDKIDYF
uniref:XS domain-containing protein n=1 Tax=Oryza punctata TaxID=4537 RepID=A0A0E0K905_ORYPU